MNIRDLRYLLAVNKHKHFGKAAEESFVSQPALSMQLKKLEEELGVRLFERSQKNMLTAIGEAIIPLAQAIVMQVESIKDMAKTAHNPFSGQLKLGAFPTLAPYIFPKVVKKIKERLPDLTLLLVEEKTEVLLQHLSRGELDAALLALPVAQKNFSEQILFDDPFYLAVARSNSLSKLKKISQTALKEQTLLLLNQGHCLREQALDVCHSSSAVEDLTFRASSLETLRQMVSMGAGITLIPEIAMKSNDDLCYIPFTKPVPSRSIGMVWRKECHRTPCIEEINSIILSVMTPSRNK